jgi:hypothetical protein
MRHVHFSGRRFVNYSIYTSLQKVRNYNEQLL